MDQPGDAKAYRAARVNLTLRPRSTGARLFTRAVWRAIEPHVAASRTRPIGAATKASFLDDLGTLLGGIVRPGLRGEPVRVHASPSGDLWMGAPVGRDRAWAIIRALEKAGYVSVEEAIRTLDEAAGGWVAKAALVTATARLMDEAARKGLIEATRKADWGALPSDWPDTKAVGRLTVEAREGWWPWEPTRADRTMQKALQGQLETINRVNRAAGIRGFRGELAFSRRFRHSLTFGGRYYGAVSRVSKDDRQAITFDGERAAMIDVKASHLTLLGGFAGVTMEAGDAYAVPKVPRAVVKQWIIQTMGKGVPPGRWSDDAPGECKSHPIKAVGQRVLALYPFLADPAAVLPPDALAGVPVGDAGWRQASGSWPRKRMPCHGRRRH